MSDLLNSLLISQIDSDLNQFEYKKEIFDKMEKILETDLMMGTETLIVNIKNGQLGFSNKLCNYKENNRQRHVAELITDAVTYLKSKSLPVPDLAYPMYLFISDVYAYRHQTYPFFVIAKPKNKTGILFPDNTYYCHDLNRKCSNIDEDKSHIESGCKKFINKIPDIFFKGANTGMDKWETRALIYQFQKSGKKPDLPLNIILKQKKEPLASFCAHKYLLNLPGQQPWSYRLKYIMLSTSLVINVDILQHYGIESNKINERWINLFDVIYEPGVDYESIECPYYDNPKDFPNKKQLVNESFNKVIDSIERIYKYYETNPEKYQEMIEHKAKKNKYFTTRAVYRTIGLLINKYNDKINKI